MSKKPSGKKAAPAPPSAPSLFPQNFVPRVRPAHTVQQSDIQTDGIRAIEDVDVDVPTLEEPRMYALKAAVERFITRKNAPSRVNRFSIPYQHPKIDLTAAGGSRASRRSKANELAAGGGVGSPLGAINSVTSRAQTPLPPGSSSSRPLTPAPAASSGMSSNSLSRKSTITSPSSPSMPKNSSNVPSRDVVDAVTAAANAGYTPAELTLVKLSAFYKHIHGINLRVHEEISRNTGINPAELAYVESRLSSAFTEMHILRQKQEAELEAQRERERERLELMIAMQQAEVNGTPRTATLPSAGGVGVAEPLSQTLTAASKRFSTTVGGGRPRSMSLSTPTNHLHNQVMQKSTGHQPLVTNLTAKGSSVAAGRGNHGHSPFTATNAAGTTSSNALMSGGEKEAEETGLTSGLLKHLAGRIPMDVPPVVLLVLVLYCASSEDFEALIPRQKDEEDEVIAAMLRGEASDTSPQDADGIHRRRSGASSSGGGDHNPPDERKEVVRKQKLRAWLMQAVRDAEKLKAARAEEMMANQQEVGPHAHKKMATTDTLSPPSSTSAPFGLGSPTVLPPVINRGNNSTGIAQNAGKAPSLTMATSPSSHGLLPRLASFSLQQTTPLGSGPALLEENKSTAATINPTAAPLISAFQLSRSLDELRLFLQGGGEPPTLSPSSDDIIARWCGTLSLLVSAVTFFAKPPPHPTPPIHIVHDVEESGTQQLDFSLEAKRVTSSSAAGSRASSAGGSRKSTRGPSPATAATDAALKQSQQSKSQSGGKGTLGANKEQKRTAAEAGKNMSKGTKAARSVLSISAANTPTATDISLGASLSTSADVRANFDSSEIIIMNANKSSVAPSADSGGVHVLAHGDGGDAFGNSTTAEAPNKSHTQALLTNSMPTDDRPIHGDSALRDESASFSAMPLPFDPSHTHDASVSSGGGRSPSPARGAFDGSASSGALCATTTTGERSSSTPQDTIKQQRQQPSPNGTSSKRASLSRDDSVSNNGDRGGGGRTSRSTNTGLKRGGSGTSSVLSRHTHNPHNTIVPLSAAKGALAANLLTVRYRVACPSTAIALDQLKQLTLRVWANKYQPPLLCPMSASEVTLPSDLSKITPLTLAQGGSSATMAVASNPLTPDSGSAAASSYAAPSSASVNVATTVQRSSLFASPISNVGGSGHSGNLTSSGGSGTVTSSGEPFLMPVCPVKRKFGVEPSPVITSFEASPTERLAAIFEGWHVVLSASGDAAGQALPQSTAGGGRGSSASKSGNKSADKKSNGQPPKAKSGANSGGAGGKKAKKDEPVPMTSEEEAVYIAQLPHFYTVEITLCHELTIPMAWFSPHGVEEEYLLSPLLRFRIKDVDVPNMKLCLYADHFKEKDPIVEPLYESAVFGPIAPSPRVVALSSCPIPSSGEDGAPLAGSRAPTPNGKGRGRAATPEKNGASPKTKQTATPTNKTAKGKGKAGSSLVIADTPVGDQVVDPAEAEAAAYAALVESVPEDAFEPIPSQFYESVIEDARKASSVAGRMVHRLMEEFIQPHHCHTHASQTNEYFCHSCRAFICNSCAREAHASHQLAPIKVFCDAEINRMSPKVDELRRRIARLKEIIASVDPKTEALYRLVDSGIDGVRSTLERHRAALHHDAEVRANAQLRQILHEKARCVDEQSRIAEAVEVIRTGVLRGAIPKPLVSAEYYQITNQLALQLPSHDVNKLISVLTWSNPSKYLTTTIYPPPPVVVTDIVSIATQQAAASSALLIKKN